MLAYFIKRLYQILLQLKNKFCYKLIQPKYNQSYNGVDFDAGDIF